MLNMATKILGHWEPTDRKLLGSNNPLIASILHGIFYSIKKNLLNMYVLPLLLSSFMKTHQVDRTGISGIMLQKQLNEMTRPESHS